MRAEIRELPNGEYQFEDWIENDGVDPNARYRIHCLVTVRDDEIFFDYSGSSLQAKGPCNCTYGVTASATFNAMLNLTDRTIPRNSGCYRPIRVIAPSGSVLNVAHPGPSVGGNSEIHERIVDVLFGALSSAVPDRVAASAGGSSCNFLFGGKHPMTGEFYANYHIEGSGWGATLNGDGNHTQCPINGNCRNTPVEVFETRYPWIVEEYSLAPEFRRPRSDPRRVWLHPCAPARSARNHRLKLHGPAHDESVGTVRRRVGEKRKPSCNARRGNQMADLPRRFRNQLPEQVRRYPASPGRQSNDRQPRRWRLRSAE